MQTCYIVRLTGRTNGGYDKWWYHRALPVSLTICPGIPKYIASAPMHIISICTQQFTTYILHTDAPFRARSGGYLPCMPTIRVSSHQFQPVNHSSPAPDDDWSRIAGQLYGGVRDRKQGRGFQDMLIGQEDRCARLYGCHADC